MGKQGSGAVSLCFGYLIALYLLALNTFDQGQDLISDHMQCSLAFHALSRFSYVNQNAAAPPLPQQAPPTLWGHDLTDIKKFCWENFEKWLRIGHFLQIFKNFRIIFDFFGKNLI